MELSLLLNKSLKRLEGLNPIVAVKAQELVINAYREGILVLITQGLRTFAEQTRLYDQGRTAPGPIVTNAKAGDSYHNYGLAIDFALMDSAGQVLWEVNAHWRRVAAIGKSLGFDWGGDWKSFVDYPHLEITFGLSINQLKNGIKPPTTLKEETSLNYNTVNHERFYSSGGRLFQVPRRVDGKINYDVKGTDVRWIRFKPGSIDLSFKYEKDAKVSTLVKKYDADFGFNFPFFWDGNVLGDSEDNDKLISAAYGNMLEWWNLASVNGEPVIADLDPKDNQDMLVQGAPPLLDKGNPCWDYFRIKHEVKDDIGKSRAQRTWVGKTAEGDFILAICDGRTTYDLGFTLEEETLFMQMQGAIDSINGDGGSSTVLAAKQGYKQVCSCCPTSGSLGMNKGLGERIVHHAVLIKFKKPVVKTDWEPFIEQYLGAGWFATSDVEVRRILNEAANKIRELK